MIKLSWKFVFISMNGNAISNKIANVRPDYWTHTIGKTYWTIAHLKWLKNLEL